VVTKHRAQMSRLLYTVRGTMEPSTGSELQGCSQQEPSMSDDSEIAWHREQIAKNRALLEEIESGNMDGSDVFPEPGPRPIASRRRSPNPS
jgi:hypothetical protein